MPIQITPPYEKFSYSYDRMMKNVNYPRWTQYIESLFKKYGSYPRKILDLACGTGALTLLLSSNGYEMTGLDRASGMLDIAREKAVSQGLEITFQHGNMLDFQFDREFDAVVCTYDSINYACSEEELVQTFESVASHLSHKGLFIFDVTTERNIVEHFHNKTFSENHQDYSYIWKNNYLFHSKMCRTFLTFFIQEGDLFRRYEEVHNQRIFEVHTVNQLLQKTGYKMLSAFDIYTFNRWTRNSDRINFTAQLL